MKTNTYTKSYSNVGASPIPERIPKRIYVRDQELVRTHTPPSIVCPYADTYDDPYGEYARYAYRLRTLDSTSTRPVDDIPLRTGARPRTPRQAYALTDGQVERKAYRNRTQRLTEKIRIGIQVNVLDTETNTTGLRAVDTEICKSLYDKLAAYAKG